MDTTVKIILAWSGSSMPHTTLYTLEGVISWLLLNNLQSSFMTDMTQYIIITFLHFRQDAHNGKSNAQDHVEGDDELMCATAIVSLPDKTKSTNNHKKVHIQLPHSTGF